MKKNMTFVIGFVILIGLVTVFRSQFSGRNSEANLSESHTTTGSIPVKGMVTMVDLGANECIPCKMMVPVLEKVEKKYQDKAAIIVIDVWKDKAPAKRFGIRAIPTQIFFDKEGKEVFRHEGFMGEADIDRVFNKMGVN